MFNAVRRGPASIARSILLPLSSLRSINSAANRRLPQSTRRILSSRFIRAYSTTTPRLGQRALASELQQETPEEFQSEPPPSDHPIGARNGPVTEFSNLGTRAMVCNAIIDRITRKMGLKTMTHVQSLTIDESLKGTDM